MFNQKTIFGGGRVHNDSRNFTLFELKTNMTGWIFVQGQGSFKRPRREMIYLELQNEVLNISGRMNKMCNLAAKATAQLHNQN